MEREYKLEREYSVAEIVRYNLRMWWLAVIFAVIFAAILGGYKYKSNHQFVKKDLYEDTLQAVAGLYVKPYNDESVTERMGTLIKITVSKNTYNEFIANTGYDLSYEGYQSLFSAESEEVSDIMTLYLGYPVQYEGVSIQDEEAAKEFLNQVIAATTKVAEKTIGGDCIEILDEPYVVSKLDRVDTYSISKEDFLKSVLKGAIAGAILGVIMEVVLYTLWMLLCKKPKTVEEIHQIFETPIIDTLNKNTDEEEDYKRLALFIRGESGESTRRICYMPVACPKKDVALKLAMSLANEQKKVLFVNLAESSEESSISSYILGSDEETKPQELSKYLDVVKRNTEVEKGFNLVTNNRFEEYLDEKANTYEYVVVGAPDLKVSSDAYAVAKLCDKTFVACGRKEVKNEELYRVKNTADVNDIQIEGVLVYES